MRLRKRWNAHLIDVVICFWIILLIDLIKMNNHTIIQPTFENAHWNFLRIWFLSNDNMKFVICFNFLFVKRNIAKSIKIWQNQIINNERVLQTFLFLSFPFPLSSEINWSEFEIKIVSFSEVYYGSLCSAFCTRKSNDAFSVCFKPNEDRGETNEK